ncbi:MAG: trypsin-like peptidase domain-containing protein [Dysgonomonas sp.]
MKINFSKILLVGVIFLAPFTLLFAQKGQYSFNEDKSEVSLIIDTKKANSSVDNVLRKKMGLPLLEARIYALEVNMDTVGIWSESSTKKENIWKLAVGVPLSKGFYISMEDFYLPKGAQLFAYNKDNFENAIVFSHEDNPNGGPYSIEDLTGDNVILEYVANKNITEKPKIHLLDIGYKYSDETGNVSGFGTAASCMINVNCTQGVQWQTQKKGVVRLRIRKTTDGENEGSGCTGTLINNTNNDKTPYILTAYHCLENVDISNPDNFSVFFNYESPSCENTGTRPSYKFHRGANVKVAIPISGGSDGVLLQLTGTIPEDWDVYFNGWDRNNTNNVTNGAVIHHPQGDIKKITLYDKALTTGQWDGTSPLNSFWIVSYSEGSTEKGSSGSSIFNQNGLVIGTLTGGNSSCSAPSASDFYGKFGYHWDKASDENLHMSKYLDPINSGQAVLAGLHNNPNLDEELILSKSNINLLPNSSSTINILSGNGDYVITSSDNNIATTELSGNVITIKALKRGTAKLTVTDKKGKSKEVTIYVQNNIDISVKENNILINIYNEEGEEDPDKIKQVRVINLDADVLYDKKNLDESDHTIDMSLFRNSIYIIQVKTKKGTTKAEKVLWQK